VPGKLGKSKKFGSGSLPSGNIAPQSGQREREVSMSRLYAGEVELPPGALESLEQNGCEVVLDKSPLDPGANDLALIPAKPGITSSLRHEVNNPLTAVIGFTQLLLRRTELDSAVLDRLGKIQEHALRVRDLIQRPETADG
jgi:signal transduction histidine kinase